MQYFLQLRLIIWMGVGNMLTNCLVNTLDR